MAAVSPAAYIGDRLVESTDLPPVAALQVGHGTIQHHTRSSIFSMYMYCSSHRYIGSMCSGRWHVVVVKHGSVSFERAVRPASTHCSTVLIMSLPMHTCADYLRHTLGTASLIITHQEHDMLIAWMFPYSSMTFLSP